MSGMSSFLSHSCTACSSYQTWLKSHCCCEATPIVKMVSYVFSTVLVLVAITRFQAESSCISRDVDESNTFVGGGAGNGNAAGNGTAAGIAGVPSSANVTVGSLAAGSGGSFSNGSLPGFSQGSFSAGLGVVCGSADATGANATAGMNAQGTGSSNGSSQSETAVLVPLPPV